MRKLTTSALFVFAATLLSSCKNDFLAKDSMGYIPILILIALITIMTIAVLKKSKLF